MAQILKKVGLWELTHAELRSGGKLVDEKYTIKHPTKRAEFFDSLSAAEKRFAYLVGQD